MADFFVTLCLFAAKALIIVVVVLALALGLIVLLAKAKQGAHGRLTLENLNEKRDNTQEALLAEVLPKKAFKQWAKDRKKTQSAREKSNDRAPAVYVLNFIGDLKASATEQLREEITAIITIASPADEVVLRVESAGGMVHGYGLAAAELKRLKDAGIKLTVAIDKVAASGGYLMACIADYIIAAPFAIIGSIGVIVQLPNFHRLLKNNDIDFEMQTAGEYKRTITVFGENTDAGREKLKEELEHIHTQFKQLIASHRPQINMSEVATGEHWLGEQALALKLVDAIQTSDAYLLEKSKHATVYALAMSVKKPFIAKLTEATANALLECRAATTRFYRLFE